MVAPAPGPDDLPPNAWPRSEDPDLKSDVRLLKYQVEQLSVKLDRFFDEVKNNYATKSDLDGVRADVKKTNDNISWVVKIIIGAVLVAALGLVIAKGGGNIPR